MFETLISEFADPFAALPWPVMLMRMVFAVLLGGMIGWEREIHTKAAGLRTHILISLAACLFTLLAFELMSIDTEGREYLRMDPLRLIEAVTAGVAFLAAGSIITSGGKVHGLTTGASMWMCGAVGLACGLGKLPLALLATAVAIVVLWLLRRFLLAIGARHGLHEHAFREKPPEPPKQQE